MKVLMQPSITMSQIYGEEVILSPRASPNACAWLPTGDAALDFLTGAPLCIIGSTPVLCSACVSTPEGLELLRHAGFPVAAEIYRFRDGADYLRQLKQLSGGDKKIALYHAHPAAEIEPESCLVSSGVLSFLNNKAHYEELVDASYLPRQRTLKSSSIVAELSEGPFPLVLKAATDESTGGGFDVAICRAASDLEQAALFLQSSAYVVVEEFLPMVRNLCLGYAVNGEGDITYLGCSEQVIDNHGKYLGNWIGVEIEAPGEAIALGEGIVREGFKRGYRGIVGMDMAVMENGRVLVFDLNFRVNGSSATLILAKSIYDNLGSRIIRLKRLSAQGTYREMLDAVYAAMDKGMMWPLNSYDPQAGGTPQAVPCLTALILGKTRDEVIRYEEILDAQGLRP